MSWSCMIASMGIGIGGSTTSTYSSRRNITKPLSDVPRFSITVFIAGPDRVGVEDDPHNESEVI